MTYGIGDVRTAGASPSGRLVRGKQGFDDGSHDAHEAAPEEAPEGSGELERSLATGGVRSFLLGDPYSEVDAGPDGVTDVQVGGVGTKEALADQVGDEGHAAVVYFVWPIVHTGRGSGGA